MGLTCDISSLDSESAVKSTGELDRSIILVGSCLIGVSRLGCSCLIGVMGITGSIYSCLGTWEGRVIGLLDVNTLVIQEMNLWMGWNS